MITEEEVLKRVSDSYELPNNVLNAQPEPMVSVRTSTFQHAKYIEQCMEGILMQKTDFSYEYIIGEDYSSDGTREIVFKYAENFPDRIRVATADYNVGSKANGRRCINMARGKYMAVCEGDDYWTDPYKLQRQVELLEKNPEASGAFTDTLMLTEEGNTTLWRDALPPEMGIEEVIATTTPFHTSSFFHRKSILDTFPEWHNRIHSGDLFLFALTALNGKLLKADVKPTVYRKHAGGITKQPVHQGLNHHLNRIFLWTMFNNQYNVNSLSIQQTIIYHLNQILKYNKLETFQERQNGIEVLLKKLRNWIKSF